MKKILFLFLALIMVLSVVGCTTPGSTPVEQEDVAADAGDMTTDEGETADAADAEESILYLASLQDPESLDPQIGNSNYVTIVTAGLYEGLVNFHNGEYLPGVAKTWSISDDGTVYTFNLRDNAVWSDGKSVTAEDFVLSLQLLVSRPDAAGYSYLAADIKNAAAITAGEMEKEELGAVAVDEYTLEITLESPTSYFMSLASFPTFYPIRADAFAEWGEAYGSTIDKMITNGPYMMAEMEAQNQYVMVKNENYWDADNISLDGVTVYIIPDENTQMNMFETGEIDVVDVANEYIEQYLIEGKANVFNNGALYFIQISGQGVTPETGAIVNNHNFKMAFSSALDRAGFVNAVYKNGSQPSVRQVLDKVVAYDGAFYGDLYYNTDYVSPHPMTADLEKAQEYMALALEELGYDSVDDLPALDFLISDRDNDRIVAEYVQDAVLSALGIKTEIRTLTFSQKYDEMQTFNYDIGWAGWGPDYNDANTYLDMFTSQGYAGAYIGWGSDEYDALIKQASLMQDGPERADVLFEAEQYILEYGPIIPLYAGGVAWAGADNVSEFYKNFVGAENDYLYVVKE